MILTKELKLSSMGKRKGLPNVLQYVEVICDECDKIYTLQMTYVYKGREKYQKDLCIGCKQRIAYKNGVRVSKGWNINYTIEYRNLMSKRRREVIKKEKEQGIYVNNGSKGMKHTLETRKKISFKVQNFLKNLTESDKKYIYGRSGFLASMYNKIVSNNVGSGWGGWYKTYFFRSIFELSYIVNVLEKSECKWKTGETISVFYKDIKGNDRSYRPDFIINDKKIIEIKPNSLVKIESNQLKFKAMEVWSKQNKYEFFIETEKTYKILKTEEISKLYREGKIKWIDRIQKKYDDKYNQGGLNANSL